MIRNPFSKFIRIIIAITCLAFPASGFTISRSDRMTIINFVPADFGESKGRVEEELGWRLGCYLETPAFDLPKSSDAELEIIMSISAEWEAKASSAERIPRIFLGVVELNYLDQLNRKQFFPKMLRPSHLCAMHFFSEGMVGRLFFYGGSLEEKKPIVVGPTVLPA